jgi:spermidine/putrescine transport system substrate-binding protein
MTRGKRRWRPALSVLVVTLFALVLVACGEDTNSSDDSGSEGGGSGGGTGTLTISNWDQYTPEDLIPSFEKETGIKVKLVKHATNEEVLGKLEAANGGGFDIVFVSGPFAESLRKRGWAAEIDKSKVPNLDNLYPEANELAYDPGNEYSVPYTWGTTGICYRSDQVKETPDSWNDLLEPAPDVEGKTTMLATDRWLLLPALKTLGYSANTTNEDELNEARDMLLKTKDTLLAYDDTTFYSKLVSGEAKLVEAWDGWCNYGIAENDKIKFVVPKEGSDLWTDTMVVLGSSENKDAAMKFINHVLKPENGKAIVDLLTYNTPNQAGMEQLDPKTLKQFPLLGRSPEELLEGEELRDLGEGQPTWSRIVTEITG